MLSTSCVPGLLTLTPAVPYSIAENPEDSPERHSKKGRFRLNISHLVMSCSLSEQPNGEGNSRLTLTWQNTKDRELHSPRPRCQDILKHAYL